MYKINGQQLILLKFIFKGYHLMALVQQISAIVLNVDHINHLVHGIGISISIGINIGISIGISSP